MQQGQGHRRGAWTAVGETARQRWYKGQGGLFRQVAAHVEFGIDPRLKAANELQNQATAVDNRAIALFCLHPAHGQGLLERTAHFGIDPGGEAAELASAAGQAALFLNQGEQGGGGSISPHGIVQQTLPLRAAQAGERDARVGLQQRFGGLAGTNAQDQGIRLRPAIRVGHLDEHQVDQRRRRLDQAIVHQTRARNGACFGAKPALLG